MSVAEPVSIWTSGGSALIGAATAVFSKYITDFYFSRIKENKSKRVEIAIRRVDEQIGKFYAPLLNYVEQLATIAKLKDQLIADDPGNGAPIAKFMYDEYFLSIHKKIAAIIEQNLHLLEGRGCLEVSIIAISMLLRSEYFFR